ncbi:MAG: Bax inhibitor-1/YccA family protein [Anaerolineae bacterium]|nr:Bax inhibitor-1/YccA family protein [Anaerolineae bacterium]
MNTYDVNPTAATSVAVSDPAIERAFITRVYGWMAIALAITGLVAVATAADPALMAWIFSTSFALPGILIVQLIIVIVLSAIVHKLSAGIATGLLIIYAALTGFTFSVLFYVYTTESIGIVFFITAGTFAVVSAYGWITKADLTRVGNLAFMGLIGILLASLINFFLGSETLYWIITYISVAVFVGLIASKTQQLKRMAHGLGEEGELRSKAAIVGALSLYLSFINLFLSLLRIFGRRR